MESSARATKRSSGKSRWFWWLLTGLALGVLGTIFIPDLVRPYLPEMMRGENVEISGIVEAKSREADRLLLTIAGSSGAVLVTYTRQIPEMDLLIEPGDSVILAVREYAPFVEDPSVRRVQKASSTIQRRPEPAEVGQANQPSAIERRPKESPVTPMQPNGEDADRTPRARSARPIPWLRPLRAGSIRRIGRAEEDRRTRGAAGASGIESQGHLTVTDGGRILQHCRKQIRPLEGIDSTSITEEAVKKLCLLVALAFSSVAMVPQSASAQTKPVQLGLVTPLQIVPEDQSVGAFRLCLIYCANEDVADTSTSDSF